MKYSLAVFDLDGTILDTLSDLTGSLNYALSNNGMPERSLEEVRRFVGNGIRKLIERGVPAGTPADITDLVHADFTKHYKLHCADNTKPYDGITEVLREIKSRGIKIAVVSNKADYAVKELCLRYFPGIFYIAVGEREGIRRKPAPDSVNAVLSELKTDRSEAVYIGDSDVDIQTAANAGIDCISVEWGFRDRQFLIQNGAKIILSKPCELTEHICL
ncbi:MAG: HAD family hydrolase [Firmicutes bacterium]|nr:HAD family hydrolase [Bacillota bacterium]